MNEVTVFFPYNLGDLVASIAGFQKIYHETGKKVRIFQQIGFPAYYYEGAEHPTVDSNGQHVSMNEASYLAIKPLLEAQDYVSGYEIWQGEKCDWDMSDTRDRKRIPMPYGDIHFWPFFIFPELSCDLSHEWVLPKYDGFEQKTYKQVFGESVIINRTSRYTNPYIHYYFLKKHEDNLRFVGVESEYKEFCEKWGLKIPKIHIKDFHELAKIMYSAKGFIGNQSFCWHLADAMKIPRVLEYCPQYPNTHPTGNNGHAAVYQEALEIYVNKLFDNE